MDHNPKAPSQPVPVNAMRDGCTETQSPHCPSLLPLPQHSLRTPPCGMYPRMTFQPPHVHNAYSTLPEMLQCPLHQAGLSVTSWAEPGQLSWNLRQWQWSGLPTTPATHTACFSASEGGRKGCQNLVSSSLHVIPLPSQSLVRLTSHNIHLLAQWQSCFGW